MIKQISKNLLIIIFFITTSCGYKALEGLDTYNLNIKEFNTFTKVVLFSKKIINDFNIPIKNHTINEIIE